MSDQPFEEPVDQPVAQPVAEETVPIPPKNSGGGGGNKVLLIILGVIVACMLLFGIVLTAGVLYVKNRGANIVKDIAKTQGVDVKNYDAKTGSGEYTVKTDDGEITTKVSKELPDDYPANELPVYNGVITTTNRMSMSGTKNWSIIMETGDSMETVGDTLKKDLVDNGWDIVVEQDSDDHGMKTAKKDGYSAVLGYREEKDDDDKAITRITYTVTRKDKDKD